MTGQHETPTPHPIRDELEHLLHSHRAPATDPGHLLPDDEWARVVADAEAHPANPHHPGSGS